MRPLSRRANHILKLAREAAGQSGRRFTGTEHLLLGIVRDGGSLAAGILLNQGTADAWTQAVADEQAHQGPSETWVTGRLPGSPHFMDVFARAERIAQRLGHSRICAEHLLAALLTLTGSMGYQVLRAMGISIEIVDEALRERVPVPCS